MAKISSNYTIEENIVATVVDMAKTELNGNRISKSLMVELLLKEAIEARGKNPKVKKG